MSIGDLQHRQMNREWCSAVRARLTNRECSSDDFRASLRRLPRFVESTLNAMPFVLKDLFLLENRAMISSFVARGRGDALDARQAQHQIWSDRMLTYLWIAIGGALGSMARFWCNGIVSRHFGETFPWGTLLINALGSFAIGFFATF